MCHKGSFAVDLNAEAGPTAKRSTIEAKRQQTDIESVRHKEFFAVDLNAEGPTAKRITTEANRQQTDSESVCHKGFFCC